MQKIPNECRWKPGPWLAALPALLQLSCIAMAARLPRALPPPPRSGPVLPAYSNLWVERLHAHKEPEFAPVDYLEPDVPYSVIYDLSGASYPGRGLGISRPIKESLRAALQRAALTEKTVTLTAYMLRDSEHFDIISTSDDFDVDLAAYAKWMQSPGEQPKDALSELRQNPRPPFVFGRARLNIKPRRNSPEGWAGAAVLLWQGNQPLDELVLWLCIAKSQQSRAKVCGEGGASAQGPLRVHPVPRLDALDAALHIVEFPGQSGLQPPRMMALFRQRGKDQQHLAWPLGISAQELEEPFAVELPRALNLAMDAQSKEAMLRLGDGIRNSIFPPREKSARQALRALETLAERSSEVPRLLVRIVAYGASTPMLLPLGLLTLRAGESAVPLGQQFKLRLPLGQEWAEEPAQACVRDWVVALPPDDTKDDELQTAIQNARLSQKKDSDELHANRLRLAKGSIRQGFYQLYDWATRDDPPEHPTLFMIVGHHTNGGFSYDSINTMTSQQWSREFAPSSVAILNGCGTGQVGASRLIPHLNAYGIASFITTASMVRGAMAGDFIDCFVQKASLRQAQPPSLEDLHFQAVQCLGERPSTAKQEQRYGALAYTYMLLGNGATPICGLQ